MSRRLRQEELKVQQIKQEEEEEEDKLKLLRQRIAAPIVWARMACGVRIQDLRDKYYDDVVTITMNDFINEDVLFRNAEIANDEESLKTLTDRTIFVVKDSTSLVAIDETNQAAVGFLLMKIFCKSDYGLVFSRVTLNKGVAMQKILGIETAITKKVDLFEKYNCESYAQIISLIVARIHRKKSIGFQLLKSAFDLARNLKQKIIVALFDSGDLQNKAKKLGMEVINEINYVDWRGKDGEMIFDDPGAGNYSVALMVGFIPEKPIPEPQPQPPPENNEPVKPENKTRLEKKAEKAKAKKKK